MKYLFALFAFSLMLNCSTTQTPLKYSKIVYEAGPCYGFCPIYKMTINEDRSALFEAEQFNFSQERNSEKREGTFKGTIKPEDYQKLISMLNSLKPMQLKAYYGNQNVSDLPTSFLKINFQNGTKKDIEDYGKHGTPELEEIYQFFETLKTSQAWTKIE